jgi:hypothetical protein
MWLETGIFIFYCCLISVTLRDPRIELLECFIDQYRYEYLNGDAFVFTGMPLFRSISSLVYYPPFAGSARTFQ